MKAFTLLTFAAVWILIPIQAAGQSTDSNNGLEDIIVELYHISQGGEATDSNGQNIPEGTVTYRIYVDLKKGYKLQAIYGIEGHPLKFETTTTFYNHIDWGGATGNYVNSRRIDRYGVALDSWLAMGDASREHAGVPLTDDHDGSILELSQLIESDGLIPSPGMQSIVEYGIDLTLFDEISQSGSFITQDGALAVLGGVAGPTTENRILVAQLTTDGQLSFELNLQVTTPHCETENYVARNPGEKEMMSVLLTYPEPLASQK